MKKVTETEKEDEMQMYEDIKSILMREIAALKPRLNLSYDEIKRLAELTKMFSTLKDDLRADLKAGILAP